MELVIKETLEKLLEIMGISFTGVKVGKETPSAFYVEIQTESSNLLIGWHGETINAIQHLLKCLLWRQGPEKHAQIIVDVDGYKKRQEESVLRLAQRKAEFAIASQQVQTLPPMNPYFRRKVHMHLAEKYEDKIVTESVGVEPQRQLRIMPK
ncbi:hypothetical protein HZA43_05165 [Candidatus Peregrinibacteria bacterium]|nr:hypothetical protein [Candidatus Peregrinibacteria bacterium]